MIYDPVPGVPIYFDIPIPGAGPDLTKPWCYFIDEDEDTTKNGGFVPSIVVQNVWGHWPMTGKPGSNEPPWVWGATLEEARARCDEENRKLGVTPERAIEIVLSSMRAPETEEPKEDDKMAYEKWTFVDKEGAEWRAEVKGGPVPVGSKPSVGPLPTNYTTPIDFKRSSEPQEQCFRTRIPSEKLKRLKEMNKEKRDGELQRYLNNAKRGK